MRIAIVNAARNFGGQEGMALLLASGLSERGHDVLFLCRPRFPALERIPSEARVRKVLGGVDWNPVSIARARSALKEHGSRVLLATTNKDMRTAALSAASLDVPVVVRRAMARPLKDTWHYRYLYGKLPAHIVVNSRSTRRIVLESAQWIPEERVSVIHNGIDTDRFAEAEAASLGVPDGAVTVGFVGRFVDWKGVLTLVDAWNRVRRERDDVWLVLAGEGEMEPKMRERLDSEERVRWLGFRDDVPAVMKALDVLAYPSVMEGFGLAAVEAMAAGIPVVVADACALPEVVRDGTDGYHVPPDDPEALAGRLLDLVADRELRERMGEAGRTRAAERFSRERMMDEYESRLLATAAGGKGPGELEAGGAG